MTFEDVPLGKDNIVSSVRSLEGAHIEDFDVHEITAENSANHEFFVTEQSMGLKTGRIALESIENESAKVTLQTPDGFTMSESLIRDLVPEVMAKSGITMVELNEQDTNVPVEKIENSGFTPKNNRLMLNLRPRAA